MGQEWDDSGSDYDEGDGEEDLAEAARERAEAAMDDGDWDQVENTVAVSSRTENRFSFFFQYSGDRDQVEDIRKSWSTRGTE